jgi:hypothetical protein
MSRFFVRPDTAEGWQEGLARPSHWKKCYSAHSLAYTWHPLDAIPPRIEEAFDGTPDLAGLELIAGIPEYRVALPGGDTASQTDLFVLARSAAGRTVAVAVEGKAEESFGPKVAKWRAKDTPGKTKRLKSLLRTLDLQDDSRLAAIRYQLLHRTASAVIEADRLGADAAAMVVHSFSPGRQGFRDFAAFARLYGVEFGEDENAVRFAHTLCGRPLYIGWVSDEHPK